MGGVSGVLLFIILSLFYSFGLLLLNTSPNPPNLLDDFLLASCLAEHYRRPHRPSRTHHIRHYGLCLKALSHLSPRLNPPRSRRNRPHPQQQPQQQCECPTRSKRLVPDPWDDEHTPMTPCMDSYHRWVHMESRLHGLETMFPSFTELESLASQHGTQMDDIAFHHDPLRQFKTIQLLCGGSFLETTYKRKRTRWKPRTHQCMVAAATFS